MLQIVTLQIKFSDFGFAISCFFIPQLFYLVNIINQPFCHVKQNFYSEFKLMLPEFDE